MTIALICPEKAPTPWLTAFAEQAPDINIEVWPNISNNDAITLALCWQQPTGSLLEFSHLNVICSMGAGIDHLLNDKKMPANIPVTRIIDPNLATSMFEYLLTAVTDHMSALNKYRQQQAQGNWQWQRQVPFSKTHIGILGLGQLGSHCASKFAQLGFQVSGWSTSKKDIDQVTTYSQDEFDDFIKVPDVLICLLPLTDATRGILNKSLFNQLKSGCYLINVARGGHLVEADFIEGLERKQLSGACLDVFEQEPLPASHPFWQLSNVTITPHCSSLTRPRSVAKQIIENYHRGNNHEALINVVDISRQY